jgi:hypothetical protein
MTVILSPMTEPGQAARTPWPTLDRGAMLATIDAWVSLMSQPTPAVEPGSSLHGDARKSPSLQVAHAAWNGIAHSVDHLHALRALMLDAQILNIYAPFTLVRSAMENAATAVWLLEPPQRPERLRRRLKLARHETWESGQVHKLLPAAALKGKRTTQQRLDEIRALAIQLHLDPDEIAGQFSYERVIRTVGEATGIGGDLSVLIWRFGSGFAHGRYWASFSLLQREEFPGQDGVVNIRLTNDVDKVLSFAGFPFAFTNRALQLYEQRRRRP